MRGSPAGMDAGGTRHGGRLGARSEHSPTGPATALSLGMKSRPLYQRLRYTAARGMSERRNQPDTVHRRADDKNARRADSDETPPPRPCPGSRARLRVGPSLTPPITIPAVSHDLRLAPRDRRHHDRGSDTPCRRSGPNRTDPQGGRYSPASDTAITAILTGVDLAPHKHTPASRLQDDPNVADEPRLTAARPALRASGAPKARRVQADESV